MFKRSLGWLALSIASLIMLSFAATASVSAAGISVNPRSGGLGTTFVVSANGFQPNSIVDTWVTRPDGKSVGLGTLRANGAGQVTFGVMPQFGWPSGDYVVVAHSRAGKFDLTIQFGFNSPAPAGSKAVSTTITPVTSVAGMTIQPTTGNPGTTFTLTAGGFYSHENVAVWVVAPGGGTFSSGVAAANAQGALQVTGQVPTTAAAGTYTAYAQGQTSGRLEAASFTVTVPSYPNWKGEYYNNRNLSGSPVLVRNDTAINFDWGAGSPGAAVNSDHFSVRWTRNQYFNAGTYQFTTTTDDGVRLWVNGSLLIDAWYDQSASHTATITLAAGTYPIEMDYYEDTGNAMAELSWGTGSSTTQQAWTGYYYNNMSLSGSPVFTRQDATLNFNWNGGSPGGGIAGTNWSAEWISTQYAPNAGNYTITVTADDGVRVWVDGNLVIDQWHDEPATTYSVTGYLNAGAHSLQVEYYQHNGGSLLSLGLNPS